MLLRVLDPEAELDEMGRFVRTYPTNARDMIICC